MGNLYSTSTNVLNEIPGTTPSSLTTGKVDGYIEDASRYVDARLPNYAGFAGIGGGPSTPRLIEKISRLIAAHDCLVFMGEERGDASAGSPLRDLADAMLDDLNPKDGSLPRAYISPSEYDYTQSSDLETIRDTYPEWPHTFYSTSISRTDYPDDDVEDI